MSKYCKICRSTTCGNHGKDITLGGEGWKCDYIPVPTNADRIRAMTDEELAAFMFSMVDCVSCENKLMNNGKLVFGERRKTCTDKAYYAMCKGDGRKCESVCLKWLQQPAEGDA